ncbi:AmmeMemoRadiSam system protein B [Candidatus Omnitrophota bacterium]
MIRKPAVSGQFYPGSAESLKEEIEKFIDKKATASDAIACVLPHAGYVYSGSVAGKTVSRLRVKDNVILLGPNHTGYGAPFSIMTEGYWQTPLGKVEINSGLAKAILNNSSYLTDEMKAHVYEHSLEVELPFLQYYNPSLRIVPIVAAEDSPEVYRAIGKAIAEQLKEARLEDASLIIASSDMTHYEPRAKAEKKDKEAIGAILELNEDKLIEKIKGLGISMCGYVPVAIMLAAAKLLGAKTASLIGYQTSGDVTGDQSSVVGYAGIIVTR